MKKLRLKSWVKNALIVISLYSILIVGTLAIGARNEYLEQQKSANPVTETVSTN